MIFLYWTVFAIGAAFFWWVEYQDDKWSESYEMTTSGEANWWSRDKTGYYSRAKALTATGIYFAAVTAGAIFIPHDLSPLFAGMFLAAAGGVIWSVVHKNVKVHKAIRAKQLATLAKIRQDPDNAKAYLGNAKLKIKNLRHFWMFDPFWDFRADSEYQPGQGTIIDQEGKYEAARLKAEAELIPRFVKLAQLPVSEQFSLDRSKKV